MAIERIWQAGGEVGDSSEWSNPYNLVCATTLPYTGSYGFYGSWSNVYGWHVIPATRQIRVGWWVIPHVNANYDNIRIRNSGGTGLIHVYFDGPSDDFDLEVNSVVKDIAVDECTNEWMHLCLDIKIDSSVGWAYLYKNGIEIASFDGNTGNSDIDNVLMGEPGGTGNRNTYFDDVYIDDTTGETSPAPGPSLRFVYISPDDNGNYSQWDGSDGNQVDNYLLVDEVPIDNVDYVETTVSGNYDSYGMEYYQLSLGESILAVIPMMSVQRDSNTEEIALGTRYSSTDLLGSPQTPTISSYSTYRERLTTKPGGGSWDQAAVSGFEVLIKSDGSY